MLKAGNTFVVNDANGDIRGNDDGLFVNDTRVLSQLRLTFGGRAPSLLSGSVSSDNAVFTAHMTNRPLPPIGGATTPEGVLHVERRRVLSRHVLHEAIVLTNYGTEPATVPLLPSTLRPISTTCSRYGVRRVPNAGKCASRASKRRSGAALHGAR